MFNIELWRKIMVESMFRVFKWIISCRSFLSIKHFIIFYYMKKLNAKYKKKLNDINWCGAAHHVDYFFSVRYKFSNFHIFALAYFNDDYRVLERGKNRTKIALTHFSLKCLKKLKFSRLFS